MRRLGARHPRIQGSKHRGKARCLTDHPRTTLSQHDVLTKHVLAILKQTRPERRMTCCERCGAL